MFFTLSKIFTVFLMPLTWIILLMAVSFFIRKQALRITFRLIALLMLLAFSNSYLTREAAEGWGMPLSSQSDIVGKYEVGIVLGGGMVQRDKTSGELVFFGNTDRILKAIELYKSGKIQNILISGGDAGFYHKMEPEAKLLKSFIIDNSIIPERNIWVDTLSRNTHENAVETKLILKGEHVRGPSLLITSGFHMKRSLACFKNEEVEVVPFVSFQGFLGDRTDFEFYVAPSASNLIVWQRLFHEWFGWFFYRISGYI